ncbi:MAG: glycosyltransferase family 39 protein [Phycisphaerae bacterium]|nr:glycosyltransferase family 39 protein [Phycisphaerae bacterium]
MRTLGEIMSARDSRWWRGWCAGVRGGAALAALCLSVYLPGLAAIPPVDRDEARFAQASRQMFESVALPAGETRAGFHAGGLAVPMVQDRPRLNKPPLIYWMQAASAAVFTMGDPRRDAIWMYRVPSVVGAMAAVLLTWRMGCSMFDARAAWLGAALLAVCPMVVWDAHQARADQVLLACAAGTQWALWACWRGARGVSRGRSARAATLWVCIGLGVLAKGPIVPMVAALAALALGLTTRRWAWMRATRPLLGVCVVLVMVAPWLLLVAGHVGWERYLRVVFDETIGRSAEAKEGHWGPPGYHLALLAVLLWPGSMLTAKGVARAWRLARGRWARGEAGRAWMRGRDAEVFCLAWVVPSWVVFEAIGTKLPHYTLPLYPALALLSARAVFAAGTGRLSGLTTIGNRFGLGLWRWGAFVPASLLSVVLLVAAIRPERIAEWVVFDGVSRGTLVLGAAGLIGAGATLWMSGRAIRGGGYVGAQLLGILAAIGVAFAATRAVAPALAPGEMSRRIAGGIRSADATGWRPLASLYHEDSLIFQMRGRVERIERGELLAHLRAHPHALLVITGRGLTDEERRRMRLLMSFSRALGRGPVPEPEYQIVGVREPH